MKTHKNIPLLEQVLAWAKPEEHEQVKSYFKSRVNDESKPKETILLNYSELSSSMQDKAARMLYMEYRFCVAEQQARSNRKRWELYKEDFMLEIEEYLSCYPENDTDEYYFDPVDCNVKLSSPTQKQASSLQNTIDEYCGLVREALYNPLKAGYMAHDSCLPFWLQAFAGAITEPGLRSGLRYEVEKALDNPSHARMWEATAREDGLEEWMANMFHILGMAGLL